MSVARAHARMLRAAEVFELKSLLNPPAERKRQAKGRSSSRFRNRLKQIKTEKQKPKSSVFTRLSDHRQYMASHRLRFDVKSGKGRGLRGRDSLCKGPGTIPLPLLEKIKREQVTEASEIVSARKAMQMDARRFIKKIQSARGLQKKKKKKYKAVIPFLADLRLPHREKGRVEGSPKARVYDLRLPVGHTGGAIGKAKRSQITSWIPPPS
jgi:hypothetical protein